MEKKKLEKGEYGYFKKKQRFEIIKTLLLFGLCLAIYLTGYLQTGKKENLLTILAIVGVLPASKSAVNMIMFVRYRAVASNVPKQLEPYFDKGIVLYDLIFVLNQLAVKSECVVIADKDLVVYTQNKKLSETEIAKQIKNFLGNHGKGNCSVKVCKSEKAFLEQAKSRLEGRDRNEETAKKEQETRDKLLAFSM